MGTARAACVPNGAVGPSRWQSARRVARCRSTSNGRPPRRGPARDGRCRPMWWSPPVRRAVLSDATPPRARRHGPSREPVLLLTTPSRHDIAPPRMGRGRRRQLRQTDGHPPTAHCDSPGRCRGATRRDPKNSPLTSPAHQAACRQAVVARRLRARLVSRALHTTPSHRARRLRSPEWRWLHTPRQMCRGARIRRRKMLHRRREQHSGDEWCARSEWLHPQWRHEFLGSPTQLGQAPNRRR